MLVGVFVILGLLLLAAGAIVVDSSRQQLPPNPTQDQIAAQTNAREFIGPAISHFGMFLLIVGLLGAVMFLRDLDLFARLFLMLLAFVALLLILANSPTIFGPLP